LVQINFKRAFFGVTVGKISVKLPHYKLLFHYRNPETEGFQEEDNMDSKAINNTQKKAEHSPNEKCTKAVTPMAVINNIKKLKQILGTKMKNCNSPQSDRETMKNYCHLTIFVENTIAKIEKYSKEKMSNILQISTSEDNDEIVQKLVYSIIDLEIILDRKSKEIYQLDLQLKEYFYLAKIIGNTIETLNWIFN